MVETRRPAKARGLLSRTYHFSGGRGQKGAMVASWRQGESSSQKHLVDFKSLPPRQGGWFPPSGVSKCSNWGKLSRRYSDEMLGSGQAVQ